MLNDFRSAAHSLAKSPGFAVVAIIILALGIGASTAIFSVVHAVLLKPLGYQDAAQLVQIQSQHPEQGLSAIAPATFDNLRRESRSFAAITAQQYYYVNLTRTSSPTRLTAIEASADYFQVFAQRPLLGRTWNPEETRAGAMPVVVLGADLWRTQFNSRRDIIGETIMLDDVAHTVIGVMPASFTDPWGNGALWRPLMLNGPAMKERAARYLSAYARLRPNVTLEQARAELAALGGRLAQDYPQDYRGWSLTATDLQANVVSDYRTGLLVVLGGVGCVLLITCANVAGLCIVRSLARRKELAVRAALGASGSQLLRQMLTESLVLAALGGGLGVLLANWGVAAIVASLGDSWIPRASEIAINGPVLAATLGLTIATGLAFGLGPAWSASRTDANDALKDTAGRGSAGPAARRIRSGLVITEIALALMLLVGAGLLGRSFAGLITKKPGLRTDQVLTLGLSLPDKRYDTVDKRRAFYLAVEEAVAALPGVAATGFTQTMPFTWGIPNTLVPVGPSQVSENNPPRAFYDSVGTGFFKAAGIPLIAGRIFSTVDDQQSPQTVIISQATARRFFG
ncbi:MAG TPA: ABC transporter permease, partial [Lacunisphaera sp.]